MTRKWSTIIPSVLQIFYSSTQLDRPGRTVAVEINAVIQTPLSASWCVNYTLDER